MIFLQKTRESVITEELLKNDLEDLNAYCDSEGMGEEEKRCFLEGCKREELETYCKNVGMSEKETRQYIESHL